MIASNTTQTKLDMSKKNTLYVNLNYFDFSKLKLTNSESNDNFNVLINDKKFIIVSDIIECDWNPLSKFDENTFRIFNSSDSTKNIFEFLTNLDNFVKTNLILPSNSIIHSTIKSPKNITDGIYSNNYFNIKINTNQKYKTRMYQSIFINNKITNTTLITPSKLELLDFFSNKCYFRIYFKIKIWKYGDKYGLILDCTRLDLLNNNVNSNITNEKTFLKTITFPYKSSINNSNSKIIELLNKK